MLSTDGHMYLNITDPMCAWATYRGTLVSANEIVKEHGPISVWLAGMIGRGEQSGLVQRECALEAVRRMLYPEKVSRIWGIFTFPDKDIAERARRRWEVRYMTNESLVEINLSGAVRMDTYDSNWITCHGSDSDQTWMRAYWRGDPCPGYEPIWERLVEGRVTVLGTDWRAEAYKRVKSGHPDSLCWLEIARIAAELGSDLGSIATFLVSEGESIILRYFFNMVEADDQRFLEKLGKYISSGVAVNWADIRPQFEKESFGSLPDLRCYETTKQRREVAYLAELL